MEFFGVFWCFLVFFGVFQCFSVFFFIRHYFAMQMNEIFKGTSQKKYIYLI